MRKTLLFVLAVLLLFSCSSFIYYPNGANAPLLSEKKEMQLAVGIKGFGGDIRSAYAIGNHFGVQLNANLLSVNNTELGTEYNNGNFYSEVAGGYFKPITPHLIFETYIGSGSGLSYSENVNTGSLRTSNYSKLYLQQDIGFKTKMLTAGLALREAYVYVSKIVIDNVDQDVTASDIFIEPIVFVSLGFEKFKVNAQAGYSQSQLASMANYAPFIFSLGIESRFVLGQ